MKRLLLLALIIGFSGVGGGGPSPVAYLDAAYGVADNTTIYYDVSAGTNRYLVVGVTQEGTTQDQLDTPPTVTYGGQSMTHHVGSLVDVSSPHRVDLFGLNNAGIVAATDNSVVVSGAPAILTVHARSFQYVNQTTPVPEVGLDNTASSTPNPLLLSISAGDNSAVVSLSGCGSGGSTASWHVDLTERTEVTDGTSTMDGSLADGLFSSSDTANCECTWSTQNRAAAVAIELAPQ